MSQARQVFSAVSEEMHGGKEGAPRPRRHTHMEKVCTDSAKIELSHLPTQIPASAMFHVSPEVPILIYDSLSPAGGGGAIS